MKKSFMGIMLAGLFATAANAQTAAAAARPNDTNKDGKVSKEEYLARREKEFATKDKDKDGAQTGDEIVNKPALPDTNNDGKITKEEFRAYCGKRFDALDKDKDGFLSGTEGHAAKKTKAKAKEE